MGIRWRLLLGSLACSTVLCLAACVAADKALLPGPNGEKSQAVQLAESFRNFPYGELILGITNLTTLVYAAVRGKQHWEVQQDQNAKIAGLAAQLEPEAAARVIGPSPPLETKA